MWYDAPELRHIVSLPSDATPAEDKPTGGDDPQQDPDYDEAGWGTQSASVSYTQLIPLLVKSNQELHERLVDLESAQVTYDAQIADLESANDAKQRRIDELAEISKSTNSAVSSVTLCRDWRRWRAVERT